MGSIGLLQLLKSPKYITLQIKVVLLLESPKKTE